MNLVACTGEKQIDAFLGEQHGAFEFVSRGLTEDLRAQVSASSMATNLYAETLRTGVFGEFKSAILGTIRNRVLALRCSLECLHVSRFPDRPIACRSIRPPADTHRIFGRRWHVAHRRTGRSSSGRPPAGAGHYRSFNLFGAIKFYSAARDAGVKPIIGADVWMEPEGGDKAPSRLLLLVQNKTGYLNLCELLSRGWIENAQRGQAWMRWEWLTELGSE